MKPFRRCAPTGRQVFATVCLAAGLWAVLVTPWLRSGGSLGGHGSDGYVEIARSLASGDGFVFEPGGPAVFHRPPFYPALLSPIMLLPEGAHGALVGLLDALLLAGTCALLFDLARRWFDARAGLVAVVATVANPWVATKIGIGMLPIAQAFLFSALLAEMSRLPGVEPGTGGEEPASARGVRIGIAAAALALVHGAMLASVALLLGGAFAWLAWQRAWPAARTLLLSLAVAAACVAPWSLRNHSVTGRPIPVAGNAGFAYFLGKVHWNDVEPELPERELGGRVAAEATLRTLGVEGPLESHYHFYGLKDPVLDAELQRRMVVDVLGDPTAAARRVALNALEYFAPISWPILLRGGDEPVVQTVLRWENKAARSLATTGLLVLALAGLLRARGAARTRRLLLLYGAFAYCAPYFLFYAARSDYTIGVLPVLSLLAVLAVLPEPAAQGDAAGA